MTDSGPRIEPRGIGEPWAVQRASSWVRQFVTSSSQTLLSNDITSPIIHSRAMFSPYSLTDDTTIINNKVQLWLTTHSMLLQRLCLLSKNIKALICNQRLVAYIKKRYLAQFSSSLRHVASDDILSSAGPRSSSSLESRATSSVKSRFENECGPNDTLFMSVPTVLFNNRDEHTPLANTRFNCEPGTLTLGCTNTADIVVVQSSD